VWAAVGEHALKTHVDLPVRDGGMPGLDVLLQLVVRAPARREEFRTYNDPDAPQKRRVANCHDR